MATTHTIQDIYEKKVLSHLKEQFSIENRFAAPKILKVVVNCGVGRVKDDKQLTDIVKQISLITGQKPLPCPAKKAIASFKSREGLVIGYKVTLRGKRMYDFLNKLVSTAIPRTRDFRGINLSAVDHAGNLSLGIKEHIIFPETIGEDVRSIFGLEVTVVTNAKSKERGVELFRSLGFPLVKE